MAKFIALVSGKGGTGKTTSTLNLGQALVDSGKKTILLDANLVTPNLALHIGLMQPQGTINSFLNKESSLKEIIHTHHTGISLIPASTSYAQLQKTDTQQIGNLFSHLENLVDFVLVDSPSGLGNDVEQVLKNCDEAIVVVTPTHSSVMDALKTIKLAQKNETQITGIILNMSNKGKHELSAVEVEEILGHSIIANVLHHKKFRKSLHNQVPLTHMYKKSKMAREFNKVAKFLSLEQMNKI